MKGSAVAPWILRPFREQGFERLSFVFVVDKVTDRPFATYSEVAWAKRIFPEAELSGTLYTRESWKLQHPASVHAPISLR